MIDSKILEVAHAQITLEIGEQDKQLSQIINSSKAAFSARGMFRSGNMIAEVQSKCVAAVRASRVRTEYEFHQRPVTWACL